MNTIINVQSLIAIQLNIINTILKFAQLIPLSPPPLIKRIDNIVISLSVFQMRVGLLENFCQIKVLVIIKLVYSGEGFFFFPHLNNVFNLKFCVLFVILSFE